MTMSDLILIDRSAMLEEIDKRELNLRKIVPDLQEDEMRPTLKSIREFIANRPIVDAEPVRHGHWINRGYVCGEYDWECSVCGECEWRGSTIGLYYCPNCGAKMDGVEK